MDVARCDITHWFALKPVWGPELQLTVSAMFSAWSQDLPNDKSKSDKVIFRWDMGEDYSSDDESCQFESRTIVMDS